MRKRERKLDRPAVETPSERIVESVGTGRVREIREYVIEIVSLLYRKSRRKIHSKKTNLPWGHLASALVRGLNRKGERKKRVSNRE